MCVGSKLHFLYDLLGELEKVSAVEGCFYLGVVEDQAAVNTDRDYCSDVIRLVFHGPVLEPCVSRRVDQWFKLLHREDGLVDPDDVVAGVHSCVDREAQLREGRQLLLVGLGLGTTQGLVKLQE